MTRRPILYEQSDVQPKYVAIAAIAIFVLVGLPTSVVFGLQKWFRVSDEVTTTRPSSPESRDILGPRLRTDPLAERQAIEQAARRKLDGYGWTDRTAGIAHIPIECNATAGTARLAGRGGGAMKALPLIAALILGASAAWSAPAFDRLGRAGIEQRANARVPLDLSFRDTNDKPVTFRELAGGDPLLLVPVLHRCPGICGVTLDGIAAAVAGLPDESRGRLTLIAFSIDPREQSADAKVTVDALSARYPELHRVVALTGDANAIATVTDSIGYRYAWDDATAQYDHVAASAVVTANGAIARWLYGLSPSATDLRLALAIGGEPASLADRFILLCYHYDAVKDGWSLYVPGVLRAGGAAMILLVGGFIGMALYRQRAR